MTRKTYVVVNIPGQHISPMLMQTDESHLERLHEDAMVAVAIARYYGLQIGTFDCKGWTPAIRARIMRQLR